jgi:hypothetical protein
MYMSIFLVCKQLVYNYAQEDLLLLCITDIYMNIFSSYLQYTNTNAIQLDAQEGQHLVLVRVGPRGAQRGLPGS